MAKLTQEVAYTMSSPVSPSQSTSRALRRASWPGPEMRVGDAERAEVADRLAAHFSDGRLDQAEFSERLDRAMRAKTIADLSGLLSDLPGSTPVPAAPAGRRDQRKLLKVQLERERLQLKHEQRQHRQAERQQRWHSLRWLPFLIAIVIAALVIAHTLAHSFTAFLIVGFFVFVWLRHRASGNHRPADKSADDQPDEWTGG
jgi:hypothetical protein